MIEAATGERLAYWITYPGMIPERVIIRPAQSRHENEWHIVGKGWGPEVVHGRLDDLNLFSTWEAAVAASRSEAVWTRINAQRQVDELTQRLARLDMASEPPREGEGDA